MKIKAKDLQPGDKYNGQEICSVVHSVRVVFDVGGVTLKPEADITIERPVPTVTIEIPLKLAEELTRQEWASARLTVVKAACQEALRETHTEAPVLRVGSKVKRTRFTDVTYGRFGVGTVTAVRHDGSAMVEGPNGRETRWSGSNFEVIG